MNELFFTAFLFMMIVLGVYLFEWFVDYRKRKSEKYPNLARLRSGIKSMPNKYDKSKWKMLLCRCGNWFKVRKGTGGSIVFCGSCGRKDAPYVKYNLRGK